MKLVRVGGGGGGDRSRLFLSILVVGSVRQRKSPRGRVCGRVFLFFGSLVGCNPSGKRGQCSVLALSVCRHPESLKREGRTRPCGKRARSGRTSPDRHWQVRERVWPSPSRRSPAWRTHPRGSVLEGGRGEGADQTCGLEMGFEAVTGLLVELYGFEVVDEEPVQLVTELVGGHEAASGGGYCAVTQMFDSFPFGCTLRERVNRRRRVV